MSDAVDSENGQTFRAVRRWVLLVLGVGLVIYALIPPTNAGVLTCGGALLGLDPLFRSAAR